ncbi:hypothetical protein CYMTET_7428 [Cymbomonas tetramitiformis]|uniref:Major facilitator superfamily (MFS) profile domain-containing protein n=1 Tax=Cymbomonas tetramitiformis TaxID=36881 RepID=A0AAE0LHH0_9CHLO|nr:hypothetical protein CYMTET_7428 [Cymbomonas tetramitiformis]
MPASIVADYGASIVSDDGASIVAGVEALPEADIGTGPAPVNRNAFDGEFTSGQAYHLCQSSWIWFSSAVLTMQTVFTQKDPKWFCTGLECSESSQDDFCDIPRDSWEWEDRNESIVSTWDLICDSSWRVSFSGSAFFFGFLWGAGIFGLLADRYGRRPTLHLAIGLTAAVSFANAAAPTYWVYVSLLTLVGFGLGGTGVVSFVLAMEAIAQKYRGPAGISTQYFWCAGAAALPLFAYLLPHWRHLTVATACIPLLHIFVAPFLKESPRWLAIQGNHEQATAVMEAIHGAGASAPLASAESESPEETLLDLKRSPALTTRLSILLFAWPTVTIAGHGPR